MYYGVTLAGITATVPVRLAVTVLAPLVIAVGVAAAARANALPLALGASALLILLLIGLRSPVLILALVAALIPVEDVLVLSGTGSATATKFVGLVFAAAYVINLRRLPQLSVMPIAGWAFVLWAVASGLWTVGFSAWSDTIMTLIQMFAFGLLVGDLISRDPAAARRVMWAYSAGAIATACVLMVAPTAWVVGSGRVTAFSEQDPAQFSATLVPAVLFLLYEATRAAFRRDAGRVGVPLILAAAGLVAWGAFASGTVSALVGMTVGLVTLTMTGTGHRGGRLSITVVGLVVAGAALLGPGLADFVMERLSTGLSTGGSGREDIWAVGVTIFARHPLGGVGYGAFPVAYTPDVIRLAGGTGLVASALLSGRAPHSILVGTAAELGVVGVILLGLFVWRVLSVRSTLDLSNFARTAMMGMLAQAMLLDVLNRKQIWLVLGITVGLAAFERFRETGVPPPHSSVVQAVAMGAGTAAGRSSAREAGRKEQAAVPGPLPQPATDTSAGSP